MEYWNLLKYHQVFFILDNHWVVPTFSVLSPLSKSRTHNSPTLARCAYHCTHSAHNISSFQRIIFRAGRTFLMPNELRFLMFTRKKCTPCSFRIDGAYFSSILTPQCVQWSFQRMTGVPWASNSMGSHKCRLCERWRGFQMSAMKTGLPFIL